jgi:signal transduction histidine kinase
MPERIRILHGITAAMLRILELDRLLPEIVRSATLLESADAASVMLLDDDGEALRIVAHHGLSDEYADAQRIPMERARSIYWGSDTHVEIDLEKAPAGDPALIEREGLMRVVAMPLVHEGALIGGINVYTRDRERRFDEIDLDILHILAAQASIAITNARLYDAERQARRLQESLLESLGDGVIIAFPDGPLRMNRAAREALGVDEGDRPDRAEFRKGFELRTEDGALVAEGETPMDRALRGQSTSGVYVQRDLGRGVEGAYRMVAAPVPGANGTVVGGILSMHDLTEQREAERQKDEFLAIVSHELKTPLTPLKALAQLLRLRLRRHREDGRPLDLESLDVNLRTIERQVDRMAGLVNDLLEVSRAGQGRFELHADEFDLVPVVREVVQRYDEITAEDGRYRFSVDAPDSFVITGDAMRIEQAVTNLVGNAVKYSPAGGEVRVAVQPRDSGMVAIIVADEGIGISADELPSLGRPFARGSRRARTFSGVGIGLYLARLVAEGHGGSLVLESPGEDQGTTVTIQLPREATPS